MMPIDPDPRELLAALDELNRGLAGPTKDLQSFLASPEGLDALARIWAPLNSGLMGDPDHEHGLDRFGRGPTRSRSSWTPARRSREGWKR